MTVEMSRSEVDSFLSRAGVGVLSLSDGAETYAVPESFGYDGDRVYFQFVSEADSRKQSFAETTEVATLTAFTTDPPESVVVRGPIDPVSEATRVRAAAALAENADVPSLNVSPDVGPTALSMSFYQLVPEERSGRTFSAFEEA